MIQSSILDIIEHLRKIYGCLKEEGLSDEEYTIKKYIYDPVRYVDDAYNKRIKNHQDICTLVNNSLYLINNKLSSRTRSSTENRFFKLLSLNGIK